MFRGGPCGFHNSWRIRDNEDGNSHLTYVVVAYSLLCIDMYGIFLKNVNSLYPLDNYGMGCATLTVQACYGYGRCVDHVAPIKVGARWWYSFNETILNVSRFWNIDRTKKRKLEFLVIIIG